MARLLVENEPQVRRAQRAGTRAFGSAQAQAQRSVGREMTILGRTLEAASNQRAGRRALEFRQALRDETDEIARLPDFEERSTRFEESRKRLSEEFRPSGLTGSPRAFDTATEQAAEELRFRLDSRTRTDAIEQARADVDYQIEEYVREAGAAASPSARANAIGEATSVLDQALEAGVISQGEYDQTVRGAGERVSNARLQAFLNFDPLGGLRFLGGVEFEGDEEARQVWVGKMIRAIEADNRRERLAEEEAERTEKAEQEAFADATTKNWTIRSLQPTGEPITVDEFEEAAPFLSETQTETWAQIVYNQGGRIIPKSDTDPRLFGSYRLRVQDPTDRTALAEAERDAARGLMTRAELNALEVASRDSRFNAGLAVFDSMIESVSRFDPGIAVQATAARQEYNLFISQNPAVTRDEALREARRLFNAIDGVSRFERILPQGEASRYVLDDQRRILIQESREQLARDLGNSIITNEDAADRMIELDELEEARSRIDGWRSQLSGEGLP